MHMRLLYFLYGGLLLVRMGLHNKLIVGVINVDFPQVDDDVLGVSKNCSHLLQRDTFRLWHEKPCPHSPNGAQDDKQLYTSVSMSFRKHFT